MHNVEAQDFLAIVSVTSVSITLMEIFIKLWRMIYYNKLNYLKDVRVMLPAFDAKFQTDKQIITILGGNDGGPSASRSAAIWVNKTDDDSDTCGANPGGRQIGRASCRERV